MKYPLRGEYETAVRNIDKFVYDSVLKTGKPVKKTQNPNFLLSYNGGKAIVYEIQTNPKKYALKCWIEDLGDLKIRYKAIDDYLKKVNLPYFVDFSYNEQGISVNGQKFPIIRMEWIDGISFKQFIANNIQNPVYIRNFAEKFLEMVKVLHQHNISHGDLQDGNIMVRKNGDICLIDYDSLYVPQLSNEKDNIKGLPGYQHPNRNKLIKLSPKSDYFSELIIYLSLLVISENTSYWGKVEQEERLLFSEQDLVNPRLSPIFAELTKLSPEIQYFTLELEKFCRESDIEALQPLENLVNVYTGSKVSWDFPTNPTPNLSPPQPIGPHEPPVKPPLDPWGEFGLKSPGNGFGGSSPPNGDPWAKLGGSSPPNGDPWAKLGGSKPPNGDPRVGITPPSPPPRQEPPTQPPHPDENIWDKFDHIWNKLLKSVSSIWDGLKNWFN